MHAKKCPGAKVCFLDYPLGINTITPLVKELVHSAGVCDGNFCNQSLWATMASGLYNENQDEQLIQEFTGHRTMAVHHYKHATNRIKRQVSRIIQGAKKRIASKLS